MFLDRAACLLGRHQWQPIRRQGSRMVVCLRCGRISERRQVPGLAGTEPTEDEQHGY